MAPRILLLMWCCLPAALARERCGAADKLCLDVNANDAPHSEAVALLQQSHVKGRRLESAGADPRAADAKTSTAAGTIAAAAANSSFLAAGPGVEAAAPAGAAVGTQQPVMEDVIEAFGRLGNRGTLMAAMTGPLFPEGYNWGVMPYTEHFQGIQRQQGGNYLYVSGSGETEGTAQLFVLDMASRSREGPMASNLAEGSYSPPETDAVVDVVRFEEGKLWHAGGFSSFGNYLAVGAEAGCSFTEKLFGTCELRSVIHFFDTSNPRRPRQLPYAVVRPKTSAGAVALTQEADGRFLMVVGRWHSEILDFYRSSGTSLASDPGFELVATWNQKDLSAAKGVRRGWESYQTLNFVRQRDGSLFMVGTMRTLKGLGYDIAHLHKVDVSHSSSVSVQKVGSKDFKCAAYSCNFASGAGIYVDSPTRLLLYASDWEPKNLKIYVSEFQ